MKIVRHVLKVLQPLSWLRNKVVDCPSIAPSTFNLYQFEIEQKKKHEHQIIYM